MTFMPVDPPDGSPSGERESARREPAGRPSAVGTTALSPEVAARENARNGRWAMNDYFDGWVLLGADNKPVMRNDGTPIGFFFHDAQRLAGDLAAGSGRAASPEGAAEAHGPAAAAWLASRRALAPLDSGLNDDWDPQVQKSYFATVTKMARLLAYDYVRTTEPEEAVRRAVSVVLGNPTYVNGPRTRLWVPGKYDAEMVKFVADGLLQQALGPEPDVGIPGATLPTSASPATSTVPDVPLDRSGLGQDAVTIDSLSESQLRPPNEKLAQAPTHHISIRPGTNNRQIDNRFDRKEWNWVRNVDERNNSVSFITSSDTIAIEPSGLAWPLTNQFYYKVLATPLNEDDSVQSSIATREWSEPREYTSGFSGVSYKMIAGQRVIQANAPGAKKFRWTVVLPPQESTHGNVAPNSHMLKVFEPNLAR